MSNVLFIATPDADLRRSRRYLKAPLPERLAAGARGIPGVEYRDGQVFFDRSIHSEETAEVYVRHLRREHLAAAFQGAGKRTKVTAEDVRLINERHSEEELTAEDIAVFERYSANDVPMRRPLKFTRRALDKLAADYEEGRTVLLDHHDHRPVGRTFAADVVEETVRGVRGHWLRVRFYAVTKGASEERLQAITDIRTGIRTYDSIGFVGGTWDFRELDAGGRTVSFFEIDDDPEAETRIEGWELSMVHIGAAYGAGSGITKNHAITEGEDLPPDNNKQRTVLCIW